MNRTYKFKGRGYHTQNMREVSPGYYSVPMYRNRDGVGLGIFDMMAASPRQAFELARKQCWAEYSPGY